MDPNLIFCVRFSVLGPDAVSQGNLDILRIPGRPYFIPIVAGQCYNECKGLGRNEDLDVVPRRYQSIFQRYVAIEFEKKQKSLPCIFL